MLRVQALAQPSPARTVPAQRPAQALPWCPSKPAMAAAAGQTQVPQRLVATRAGQEVSELFTPTNVVVMAAVQYGCQALAGITTEVFKKWQDGRHAQLKEQLRAETERADSEKERADGLEEDRRSALEREEAAITELAALKEAQSSKD